MKAASMKKASAEGAILTIDVGGSHVKVMTNKTRIKREFTSGPKLSARTMVAQVKELTRDWSYDRVTVGYPGPVMRDRPAAEPHNLGKGWKGFDFARAFGRPTKVVNDASMQALGDYKDGKMLFLGLGTGLGSAMIIDGALVPMELAHLPYKKDKTFEDFVGATGLKRHGKKRWGGYVDDVVNRLVAALEPDYVVIGGGNADKLRTLPKKSRLGKNSNAFLGGFRLWDSVDRRKSSSANRSAKPRRKSAR
jgi:polyphosphate glucokinase